VIVSETDLARLAAELHGSAWLAVDTEADSLHAYPEKLCLLQISSEKGDFLIDPLAGFSLAPLLKVLGRRELLFHGADYDLRLLFRGHRFQPSRVFDTMLAARLLGEPEFNLSALVRVHLGVQLEKGPQKADWARRPLTPRMEAYALNDTRYLKPLVDVLRPALEAAGRLEWHEELCARMIEECCEPHVEDPDHVWRLKGASRLTRRGLAVLRALWAWREREALRLGRPPYFVVAHETLVSVAATASEGRHWQVLLPVRLPSHRHEGIQKAIAEAMALPPEECPKPIRHPHRAPTEEEARRFDDFKRRRDAKAAELAIEPSMIASKSTLLTLAGPGGVEQAGLMRWQRRLLGL